MEQTFYLFVGEMNSYEEPKKAKIYSGVHPQVSTLIQPNFQKAKKNESSFFFCLSPGLGNRCLKWGGWLGGNIFSVSAYAVVVGGGRGVFTFLFIRSVI